MTRLGLITCTNSPLHEYPYPHPEHPERYIQSLAHIRTTVPNTGFIEIESVPIPLEDTHVIHTAAHIETLKQSPPFQIDSDTFLGHHSLLAAREAAGAIPTAINHLKAGKIDTAFCLVRPPGHHAEPDNAMGFCLINNIALGAKKAQARGFEKVAIIDFDVHHGNGTEAIFRNDDSVQFISTHQSPFYPGTGLNSSLTTLNIPLPAGTTDPQLLSYYTTLIPDTLERFGPDIILISAGYDIHESDPLGGFLITNKGIKSLITQLMSTCEDIPKIFILEGGYNIPALAECISITLNAMIAHNQ